MQITLHIVYGFQFAAWIEQAANDQIAEHPALDAAITNAVVKRTKHQLWACHLNLGVAQTTNEVINDILLFVHVGNAGPSISCRNEDADCISFSNAAVSSGLAAPNDFTTRCVRVLVFWTTCTLTVPDLLAFLRINMEQR